MSSRGFAVVSVCLDRVLCVCLFEELSVTSEVFEKAIAGDVDNSSTSYCVGTKGCYCDCYYREEVSPEISAVSIIEMSRCESWIVCLCDDEAIEK
jgi:hypothetical protein